MIQSRVYHEGPGLVDQAESPRSDLAFKPGVTRPAFFALAPQGSKRGNQTERAPRMPPLAPGACARFARGTTWGHPPRACEKPFEIDPVRDAVARSRVQIGATSQIRGSFEEPQTPFLNHKLPFAVQKTVAATAPPGQIFEMLKVFWAVFSAKRTSVSAALRGF